MDGPPSTSPPSENDSSPDLDSALPPEALLNTIGEGIFQLDRQGFIIAVNEPLIDLTGYSRQTLLGTHISAFLDPDTYSSARTAIRQHLLQGTQESVTLNCTVDTTARTPLHCQVQLRTINHDETEGIVGVVRERTEQTPEEQSEDRHHHERARSDSKTKSSTPPVETKFIADALDNLPDLFYCYDTNLNFVWWNDELETVTGYTEDEVAAMNPTDFFEDEDADAIAEAIQEIFETGRAKVEATLTTKQGNTLPYEFTGVRLETDDGTPIGFAGIGRDITERHQREQQIARQRDQLETLQDQLLETVPTGIVFVNAEGEFTQFNQRATEILGVSPEQLASTSRDEFDLKVCDADGQPVPEVNRPFEQVLQSNEAVYNEELQVERSDGETRWLSVNGAPVAETDGQPTEMVFAFEDITKRKQREQDLHDAKAQLEAAAEAGAVGTWEWNIQEEEVVTGASFARTFGVDPDAARNGLPVDEFLSSIHEDDRERVSEQIADTVDECGEFEAEYRVWDINGELRWVVARGYVECDESGSPVRFPGAVADITERKRAEQALQESEKQLRTLLELLPVGVIVADEDGELVEANEVAEQIWGGVAEATSVAEYEQYTGWWPDTGERVEPEEWPLARALQGEEVTDAEVFEIEGFDGERRTILTHAMPVWDKHGDVDRAVVTMTDITERRERKEQLEQQNERLESFASMLAHELRNPVTIGQIYTQNLPETDDGEAVQYITEAFERIEDMIDIMLMLTQGREAVGESRAVDLQTAAQDAWADLNASGVTFELTVDREIFADETYVRHLFRNLFENAIEHGDADRITVGELPTGFYVADDGRGISADDWETVFEAGYTTAASQGGTGLGLAFVQEVAEVYNWELSVEESAEGGVRFEFGNVG